jgi:hypothetical protein
MALSVLAFALRAQALLDYNSPQILYTRCNYTARINSCPSSRSQLSTWIAFPAMLGFLALAFFVVVILDTTARMQTTHLSGKMEVREVNKQRH